MAVSRLLWQRAQVPALIILSIERDHCIYMEILRINDYCNFIILSCMQRLLLFTSGQCAGSPWSTFAWTATGKLTSPPLPHLRLFAHLTTLYFYMDDVISTKLHQAGSDLTEHFTLISGPFSLHFDWASLLSHPTSSRFRPRRHLIARTWIHRFECVCPRYWSAPSVWFVCRWMTRDY